MTGESLRTIVIVGGGTAGWMTAAALGRFLKDSYCKVILIESEQIGTVGVGEATIPQILVYNRSLGIDEDDFLKSTQGTFKLGIEFVNWGRQGDSYLHAFGEVGRNMESLPFYHFWYKYHALQQAGPLGRYTLNTLAAEQNKFMRSVDAGDSPLSNIAYAYQFDATAYAAYLRKYAEHCGVERIEGKVEHTRLTLDNGHIAAVGLEGGREIEGDFFIDCSGFRGLLIDKAMNVGFEDWSHWLPCNRAWTAPSKRLDPLPPYTRATAHGAGWQWRIPLQHRTGNGHVFAADFISEDRARSTLLEHMDGEPLRDPRMLKFTTGKRKVFWERNCLAIGLSAGFLEPLESTSIHLAQSAIARFMSLFPRREMSAPDIAVFNKQSHFEYDRIRDFIIMHYHVTERDDTEFWRYCRSMAIPDSLAQKLDQYRINGQIHRESQELFNETSWLEVFVGQRLLPKGYHPLVDVHQPGEIKRRLDHIEKVIASAAEVMPDHARFIAEHCRAERVDV